MVCTECGTILEFYDEELKPMGAEAVKERTKDGKAFSARLLVHFSHVYALSTKKCGIKSNARVIQFMPKPEESKFVVEESVGFSKAKLGPCFA